jgi:hypothetical protein
MKILKTLLLIVVFVSSLSANKMLLLNKIEKTNIDFSAYKVKNTLIDFGNGIYDNKYFIFINTSYIPNEYYVYDLHFKKNKLLSKRLSKKMNDNSSIVGSYKDIIFIANVKREELGRYDVFKKFKLTAFNLIKNKIIFSENIKLPITAISSMHFEGGQQIIGKKIYFIIFTFKPEGTNFNSNLKSTAKNYLLSVNLTNGHYKFGKSFSNAVGSYFIPFNKGTILIDNPNGPKQIFNFLKDKKYDIGNFHADMPPHFNGFKNEDSITPLSKDLYFYTRKEDGGNTHSNYLLNLKTHKGFSLFYSKYNFTNSYKYYGYGDGDGDIFIKYEMSLCADCQPITKLYMLNGKDKVLMGDGLINDTVMNASDNIILILKHFKIKNGIYAYIFAFKHKLYHYLLVDTKKIKDYEYIKPAILKQFHRVAPGLQLKNPKIIFVENAVYTDSGFFQEIKAVGTYHIPYMIKDGSHLYVPLNSSIFNFNNNSLHIDFTSPIKLNIAGNIVTSTDFYPKDKLHNINDDKTTPGFTRVVKFKIDKTLNIRSGESFSVGESLKAEKGAIQVLNVKIKKIF